MERVPNHVNAESPEYPPQLTCRHALTLSLHHSSVATLHPCQFTLGAHAIKVSASNGDARGELLVNQCDRSVLVPYDAEVGWRVGMSQEQ